MFDDQLTLFPLPEYHPELMMDPLSWVYLMAHPTDPTLVKIGVTSNLSQRQRQLGCEALWHRPGGRRYERYLHQRFSQNRLPRTEWFRLDAAMMAYFGLRLRSARRAA